VDVAYDAFAESVRLIQSEHLEPVFRLSRRRRFAPMAVDVADDVAVTLFARRGVGCVLSETWVLAKRGASWHMLGGGSGSADDDLLAPRPARLPDYLGLPLTAGTGLDPGLIVIDGSGGVHDSQGRAERWPWSGRWIRHVGLRTSADVESVALGADGLSATRCAHMRRCSERRSGIIRLIGSGSPSCRPLLPCRNCNRAGRHPA